MTIQAIYENGVFRPSGQVNLPEKTSVLFEPRVVSTAGDLPGFGLWRDRNDLPDTAQASLQLRRDMEQRTK